MKKKYCTWSVSPYYFENQLNCCEVRKGVVVNDNYDNDNCLFPLHPLHAPQSTDSLSSPTDYCIAQTKEIKTEFNTASCEVLPLRYLKVQEHLNKMPPLIPFRATIQFRPFPGRTQLPLHLVSVALYPWIKRLGRGPDDSHPSSAEVKNNWCYFCTPHIPFCRVQDTFIFLAHRFSQQCW